MVKGRRAGRIKTCTPHYHSDAKCLFILRQRVVNFLSAQHTWDRVLYIWKILTDYCLKNILLFI